jgi:hypothetical protein
MPKAKAAANRSCKGTPFHSTGLNTLTSRATGNSARRAHGAFKSRRHLNRRGDGLIAPPLRRVLVSCKNRVLELRYGREEKL